jgi:hypothetical protein
MIDEASPMFRGGMDFLRQDGSSLFGGFCQRTAGSRATGWVMLTVLLVAVLRQRPSSHADFQSHERELVRICGGVGGFRGATAHHLVGEMGSGFSPRRLRSSVR